jgi:hypothetical protein
VLGDNERQERSSELNGAGGCNGVRTGARTSNRSAQWPNSAADSGASEGCRR